MKRLFVIILMLPLFTTILQDPGFTAEVTNMRLMPPDTEGGKPLMQALSERKSSREFRPDELPPQVLSNLLWAANGVNRRTAGGLPSRKTRKKSITSPSALSL